MQAIVLAAGDGGRLHPYTSDRPKALVPLRGRPIISHVLDALRDAGVDDVVIVVGYRGDQIREALAALAPQGMRLRFCENEAYLQGNARSLWAARGSVQGPFILAMSDHLVEPGLLRSLADRADGRCRLAVDHAAESDPRAGDATKARVEGGRVLDLGKTIRGWNALDTGVFWCTPRVFDALAPSMRDGELAEVFASLARSGDLDAVDVSGRRWIDIDTEEDLRSAEAMVGDDGRLA